MMSFEAIKDELIAYRDGEGDEKSAHNALASIPGAKEFLREARLMALLLSLPPQSSAESVTFESVADFAASYRVPTPLDTHEGISYLEGELSPSEASSLENRVRGDEKAIGALLKLNRALCVGRERPSAAMRRWLSSVPPVRHRMLGRLVIERREMPARLKFEPVIDAYTREAENYGNFERLAESRMMASLSRSEFSARDDRPIAVLLRELLDNIEEFDRLAADVPPGFKEASTQGFPDARLREAVEQWEFHLTRLRTAMFRVDQLLVRFGPQFAQVRGGIRAEVAAVGERVEFLRRRLQEVERSIPTVEIPWQGGLIMVSVSPAGDRLRVAADGIGLEDVTIVDAAMTFSNSTPLMDQWTVRVESAPAQLLLEFADGYVGRLDLVVRR